MKHHIAFDHPLAALQAALGVRLGRAPRSAWVAAATAASAALRRHSPTAPRVGAPKQPVVEPAGAKSDAKATPRGQAVATVAASEATAAAHWERQGARALPWVEGLVLVCLIGFFGAGLVAILGGY